MLEIAAKGHGADLGDSMGAIVIDGTPEGPAARRGDADASSDGAVPHEVEWEATTGVRALGTTLGSYRLGKLLGEGGMGRVYEAEHIRLGRTVALKLLRSEFSRNIEAVQRFYTEARAVNKISHENIVQITDFVENADGENYYIMELLRGRPLNEVLAQQKALPLADSLSIAIQTCDALSAVHAAKIVHRDLKPENIFLSERWGRRDFVKLLDFGIVKLTEPDTHAVALDAPETVLGTPQYMSPEQAMGKEVDHQSDIYSLGIVLYEMLTGQLPLAGETYADVLLKHMTATPVRPSKLERRPQSVPAALEDLIMECLQKDPAARPATSADVLARLRVIAIAQGGVRDQFLQGLTVEVPAIPVVLDFPPRAAEPAPALPATTKPRPPRAAAAAAIGAVILALVAIILLRGG